MDILSTEELTIGGKKNKTRSKNSIKKLTKKNRHKIIYGGTSDEYKELFRELSLPSFNNTFTLNELAKNNTSQPLLMYDHIFKNTSINISTSEKLSKYGTHFYYDTPVFSQADESITSVYMSEFALNTDVNDFGILLLDDNTCIYSSSVNLDTKLTEITTDTMFNLFNTSNPTKIQIVIHNEDVVDDENYEEPPDLEEEEMAEFTIPEDHMENEYYKTLEQEQVDQLLNPNILNVIILTFT